MSGESLVSVVCYTEVASSVVPPIVANVGDYSSCQRKNSFPALSCCYVSQSQFTSCCCVVVVRWEYLTATFTSLVVTKSILNVYYITLDCGGGMGKDTVVWLAKIGLSLVIATIHYR